PLVTAVPAATRSIMSLPVPATPARADAPAPDDLHQALVGELRRAAAPLADATRTTLACVGPAGTCWVAAHPACPCSQNSAATVACLDGQPVPGREKDVIRASGPG